MAKKSKVIPLDLEEEREERAKFGGMLKEEITTAASAIETQKAKSAQASGDLSAKLEIFEKKGGHKRALKVASALASMEPAESADFLRALLAYCDALGVNDQIDMFDQQRENDLNAESIAIASSAEPDYSLSEPLH